MSIIERSEPVIETTPTGKPIGRAKAIRLGNLIRACWLACLAMAKEMRELESELQRLLEWIDSAEDARPDDLVNALETANALRTQAKAHDLRRLAKLETCAAWVKELHAGAVHPDSSDRACAEFVRLDDACQALAHAGEVPTVHAAIMETKSMLTAHVAELDRLAVKLLAGRFSPDQDRWVTGEQLADLAELAAQRRAQRASK